jgi:hypothetical protein
MTALHHAMQRQMLWYSDRWCSVLPSSNVNVVRKVVPLMLAIFLTVAEPRQQ